MKMELSEVARIVRVNKDILIGKTVSEANELLKNLGYFIADEREDLEYQNSIKVKLEGDKIVEVLTKNESKDC
jgi:hypothetical protein